MQLQDIFENLPFRRGYQNSYPCTLKLEGPVEISGPMLHLPFFRRCLSLYPLGHKVALGLSLDHCSWLVDDIVHGQLNGPCGNFPSRLLVVQYLIQNGRGMNLILVHLKIM
jgi:hypothetical protein